MSKIRSEHIYDKITNEKRLELLRLVDNINIFSRRKEIMKKASEILNINYSTAKTILRVFRKENRIFKNNSIRNSKKADNIVLNSINELRFDVDLNLFNEVSFKINEFNKILHSISNDIKMNRNILYRLVSYIMRFKLY